MEPNFIHFGASLVIMRPLLLIAALCAVARAQYAADNSTTPDPAFSRQDKYILAPRPSVPSPSPGYTPRNRSVATNDTASLSSMVVTGSDFPRHTKYLLPDAPESDSLDASVEGELAQVAPSSVSGFVGCSGQSFILNGSTHFFPGSNDYFLILR